MKAADKLQHLIWKTKLYKITHPYLHWGLRYVCPFCGFHSSGYAKCGEDSELFSRIHVIGAGRRSAACWKCNCRDRERLLYVYLRDIVHVFDSSRKFHILHFAPEPHLTERLRTLANVNYICGDLFTTGYSYPDYVKNMNVLDIPFKENSFDIVLCNHVLEHIENDQKAMQELYKVLKKTGIAILQVPIASDLAHTYENSSITEPELRIKHFGQKDHVRLYGMDYKTRLESVGFKVDMVNIADRYPKYGLNPFETLYICHK